LLRYILSTPVSPSVTGFNSKCLGGVGGPAKHKCSFESVLILWLKKKVEICSQTIETLIDESEKTKERLV